jgi:tetratricopeptide (TPR) repeat protein
MSTLRILAILVALSLSGRHPGLSEAEAHATVHIPVLEYTAVDALGESHAEALDLWERGEVHAAADTVRETFAASEVPVPPPDPARSYLVRAANYGPASPLAHSAYPVDPHTTALLFDCARLLQADGDHRAAIHLLETLLTRSPDHRDAHLAVADSRWAVGDLQDARRHYRIYLELQRGPGHRPRLD